ncbi:secretin receptor-like [Babylonia areolata]|uniref:secretin receptor-like n=1 Tax=Babylonia areolata TaxID=304850 RepID=UPI003FD65D33
MEEVEVQVEGGGGARSSGSTFSELSKADQELALYKAQWDCNKTMRTQPATLTGSYCRRTWDGVMCWPDTEAGLTIVQQCPTYINGFDHSKVALKECGVNGTWYTDPVSGKPWTNFNACITDPHTTGLQTVHPLIVHHMQGIKVMSTIGYSLSLAALILAVSIMVSFRRLHCARNLLHLNMFLAFLVRAAFSLLKTVLLVQDLGFPNDVRDSGTGVEFVHQGTHWACKLFFTLFYYVIFASLMGLFNEGFYLALLLSVSLFAERTRIRWFVLLGWGVPVIFVIPWIICRLEYDDMLCWNVHVRSDILWILRGPMVASVAVNFAFFVHIVRILFTKLTAFNCPESRRVRYRRLAKSTLILIPLFAVYYMGFMWLPDDLSPASELFKMYVEMLFNSFQGFLVALLFCFLNAEVQNEIRKKWQEHVALRRPGSWRSQLSLCSFLNRSMAPAPSSSPTPNDSSPRRPPHPPPTTTTSGPATARSPVLPPVVTSATVVTKTHVILTSNGEHHELPTVDSPSVMSGSSDSILRMSQSRVTGHDCNDNHRKDCV